MGEAGAAVEPGEFVTTRCALHPDRSGVALCDRCGDYHCAECHKRVAGRALCARCRELPGVDYLEETRRRFWGKRDGFIWYFGAVIPLFNLAAVPTLIQSSEFGHLATAGMWLVFSAAYLAKLRAARTISIPFMLFDLAIDLSRVALGHSLVPAGSNMSAGSSLGIALGGALFGLALGWSAYRSPRNKLAFEIELDERELQHVYDHYVSNPAAVRGAVYGALALFIPFANLITLFVSVRALRHATAATWPPRGGRVPALLGIALSVFGVLVWALIVAGISLRWIAH